MAVTDNYDQTKVNGRILFMQNSNVSKTAVTTGWIRNMFLSNDLIELGLIYFITPQRPFQSI
jgi:hypothetical protein